MQTLTLPAPAKLNLFLHITGRRADGYHLLQTVFQFIDYCDEIDLTRRTDGKIRRINYIDAIPEQDDLVVKAAHLLQQYSKTSFGIDIKLTKKLPMGGGLGGGSSDAATVLLGLNKLWQCQLSIDELARLGLRLGADIPIFIRGHSAWAEGVGEEIQPIDIPEPWYLVIQPKVEIATAEIFSNKALTRNCKPIRMSHFPEAQLENVFEPLVRKMYPEVEDALDWLSQFSEAKLTGSGSCIFAEFSHRDSAETVLAQLPKKWHGFVAKGKNISPLQVALNSV